MVAYDSLFQELESLFPGKQDSAWFLSAGIVFQAHDRMDMILPLWKRIESLTATEQQTLVKARMLREAFLKASVLVGFPKGINACTALRQAIKDGSASIAEELDQDKSLRSSLTRSEKEARGREFFSKIYSQHTDRVLENMARASGGDLSEFAINAVYGDLMAETTRLDSKETGLLEFLACYATGGSAWTQAKGHMYGCHNLGNGQDEIFGAIAICRRIEQELDVTVVRTPNENWSWLDKAKQW